MTTARLVFNSPLAQRAKAILRDQNPVFAVSGPGVIWVDGPTMPADLLIHENVHQAQWRKYGFIFYPLRYGIEMAVRLAQFKDQRRAYLAHSLERKAYAAQNAYRAARGMAPVGVG